MKWHEIADSLYLVRKDIDYAKFKAFKTKGEDSQGWKEEAVKLEKKEAELVQLQQDYPME